MIKNYSTNDMFNESKKNHVLHQLLDKGVTYTKSGQSIFSLNYNELIKELALFRASNS